MLISRINKKKIITNIVVLLVLVTMIGFVVFKYIIPEKKEEKSIGTTSAGVDIGKLLNVKMVTPKKLEVDVFTEDKYLLLVESGVDRMELEDLKKGKKELFPSNTR